MNLVQEEQVVVARVGRALVRLPMYRQGRTEVQGLCIMEVTTAVVAAEHRQLRITELDHRIPEVQVESEEAARVRRIRMLILQIAEQREIQTRAEAVAVQAYLTSVISRDCRVAQVL